jgi:uncharacterized protein YbjQ (UPF0145 family)
MPTISKGISSAVLASFMLAAPVAAQQAVQVALIEGDAQGDYRAAGAVSAEMQSPSSTLPKQKLDEQLRAEAAKLGADAVIQVTYQMSPAGSGVNYKATGVAIRYARQAGAVAAVAAPAVAPAPVAPGPVAAPQAVAPPVVAAAPQIVAPAAVASAPAVAVVRAGSAAQVELSETSMQGRRYVRLGPVNAKAHQTSMFPKTPPREQMQEELKAAAFRMGADAVIEVKYDMVNAMFSKKGNSASGIAVKFE